MHAFDDGDIETPTVFVKAWADPEQCFISVRDNGVGMDKTTLGKMFEPFFTTKRNKGGTGLGLSIVHSLIKGALGGDLKVQSKPMQGTEFIIMVPIGNEHQ